MFMVITLVMTSVMEEIIGVCIFTSVMEGNSRPDVAVCIFIPLFSKDAQWKGIVGPTWP